MAEIQPALTEHEWWLVRMWDAGKMPGGRVRGKVVLDLPDDHRPGAAACALYNQPFGFTREDVEAIAFAVDSLRGDAHNHFADALERLSARIAALLPPQP